MNNKKRLFYLDLIRAISMIMIVTLHFLPFFPSDNIISITLELNTRRWAFVAVMLFFMISGSALMYNYSEEINIKAYYKKRFLGIYPMFWITYILIYLYDFYMNKSVPFNRFANI